MGAGRCANRCFNTASAQAIFSFRPFAQYLAEHIERHAALPLRPGAVGGVPFCNVCATGFARNAAVISVQGAVMPSGHGIWGGPSWSNTAEVAQGAPMQSLSRPNSHHSCAEYIEKAASLIGRSEAHTDSFLSDSTRSCSLEDGSRGTPYPPCDSCGGAPTSARPPISFDTPPSHRRKVSSGRLRPSSSAIMYHKGRWGGNSGGILALLPNGALFDAPLPDPRSGRCVVVGDGASSSI